MVFKNIFLLSLLILLSLLLAACAQATTPALAAEPDNTIPEVHLPVVSTDGQATTNSYPIVDTGQSNCFDAEGAITCPQSGDFFYGQDGQYAGLQPNYVDNYDGTVTDLNTGLMWQKAPGNKVSYAQAVAGADRFSLAGYDDWRLPTIKELYSLMDFNGRVQGTAANSVPYIDTTYFDFEYGDESAGERLIDAQYWSSTEYVGTTMNGAATAFGVNFADGRIKGYPRDTGANGSTKTEFVRYVRGNPDYGINNLVDNGNNTISDLATGLTWQKNDSGTGLDWNGALNYCENLTHAGFDDWRLPNAKELHSIVDYIRAPDAQNPVQQSAAIDPIFNITSDDPFFWTSTTHMDGPNYWGAYFAFGEAWGYMEMPPNSGNTIYTNVHGAGAQRSDPKSGDPTNWPTGNGPQGDEIRVYNYARCVRIGEVENVAGSSPDLISPAAMGAGPGGQGQPSAGGPSANPLQQPAQLSGQSSTHGQPAAGQSPPQEAIKACSVAVQGTSCQMNTPHGTLIGTCMSIADQLACLPEGGPPGKQ